jgi:hypothetical protein
MHTAIALATPSLSHAANPTVQRSELAQQSAFISVSLQGLHHPKETAKLPLESYENEFQSGTKVNCISSRSSTLQAKKWKTSMPIQLIRNPKPK